MTLLAVHFPPRAVGTPRSFNACDWALALAIPSALSSARMGRSPSARLTDCSLTASSAAAIARLRHGCGPLRCGEPSVVHAFQVHLVSTGLSWPGLNQIVYAFRFFYGVTLGEAAVPERILI